MKKKIIIALIIGIGLSCTSCIDSKDDSLKESTTKIKSSKELTNEEVTVAPTSPSVKNANILSITKDDFIDSLDSLLTEYNLYTLEEEESFESEGKSFDAYTMLGMADSAYLACSMVHDSTILSDIYVTSNIGVWTYYYATNVLLAIDPNIDYEKILSDLSITEDGECEPDTYVTTFNEINFIHERTDEKDNFAIMFY